MDKLDLQFEDFLSLVDISNRDSAKLITELFIQGGCKVKIEPAKNGYVVSFSHGKTKKVVANFVFRKKKLIIRLYGDNVNQYLPFMETLPDEMIESIDKAPVCKRLVNPATCNSRCPRGYDFFVKDTHFQKCRYNCFMFQVNDQNMPSIKTFLVNELAERNIDK